MNFKEIENLIKYLPVLLTGVREGEIIQGTKTQSKNCILKIVKGNVPPSKEMLNCVRQFPDLYSIFLNKIRSIKFFSNLTKNQRDVWLKENESNLDLYFQDLDLEVDLIDYGDSDFLKLDLEHLDLTSQTYPIKYLYNLFPSKPTSEGLKGRHTLIFRRGIWKVVNIFEEYTDYYEGLVIDTIYDFDIKSQIELNSNHVVYRFNSFNSKEISTKISLGIAARKSCKLTEEDIIQVIQELFPSKNIYFYYSLVKEQTQTFTPSSYKSLLQKIIRKRAERTIMYSQDSRFSLDNEIVLCCVIGLLILHPGSFVPDIQRYVRGVESALKRTIITLYEDAIVYDIQKCIRVVCYALLCQRIPKYNPNKIIVKDCMELAITGLRSPKAYLYKFDRSIEPYIPSLNLKNHEIVSLIIDELKSFETDLCMVRYIASNKKMFVSNLERDMYMEIYHYIDFHCQPEIVYYIDLKSVEELCEKSNKVYGKLFSKLFHQVTGVNPRRDKQHSHKEIDLDFVRIVQKAQKNMYKFKIKKNMKINYDVIGNKTYKFKLDNGVLAGMLGSIEMKYKNLNCLVQLSPKDPNIIHVIKKPSRNMKNPFLNDKDEEIIISSFSKRLSKGIKLKAIPPITPYLRSVSLKKDSEYFKIITPKKREIEWSKVSNYKLCVELFEYCYKNKVYNVDLFLSEDLKNMGICADYPKYLRKIIKSTSQNIILRVLYYLNTKDDKIVMTKISRDGGGASQIPMKEDVGAFKVLCKLTLLFPAILILVSYTTFKIKNIYLLDMVRKKIIQLLKSKEHNIDKRLWGDIRERNNRTLFDYQISCLDEMKESYLRGRKGCFLWLDVGLGKTLIVLHYLKYLIDKENISYIIYTLPSSAIKSVVEEVQMFGFEYCILVPIKSKKYETYNFSKNIKPQKYKINIIEHDHLRRCNDELIHYANKSIFVIDEVHKCLNESKRTSVCLNLSKLSKFFVALTGTPIIDSNTYKLMWWLEQIVPFKVNDKNFWVATHSMVSRRVSTHVICEYKDIELEITNEEYNYLAPIGVGGLNISPKHSDIIRAMELCWNICDEHIVEMCCDYYKSSVGCFIVTRNYKHLIKLYNQLIDNNIFEEDIFLIDKDNTLYFTDETVEKNITPDYKFVLTTLNNSTGYTLTRLNKMITGVYPSNNATREQLEGRINRVSQNSNSVEYITVHCGILTYIYQKHKYTKSLSLVLKELSEEL